ncbi:MAG: methyltetrahydrofolate cobalamin methyltransferase [Eubacterium sp.]
MIIIGEKINGSIPSVAKAIANKDVAFIQNLAKRQTEVGVDFIDVCASVKDEIELETMKWLIDLVQEVTDTPLAVDSPNTAICAQVLKFCHKSGLVNSVSLEGDKIKQVFPVIADTDWQCVALLCDDAGIPKTAERRIKIFKEILKQAKEYGIKPSRLHIDPLVEMLCTSEDGVLMMTNVIREIKTIEPSVHVTGAVSNISFNLPYRRIVNMGFTVLSMQAGMDSAILDPLNRDLRGIIFATEAMLGNDEYCMEYIEAYRDDIFGDQK